MRLLLAPLAFLALAAPRIAPAQAAHPLLSIGRGAAPASVDANLTDPAWAHAACAPLFCDYQTGRPAEANTKLLAAWDHAGLYLAFRCEEPHMQALKATMREHDAPLWTDDSVEVFLRPNGRGTYYHFVVNALGALYDSREQDAAWNSHARSAALRGARAWTCRLTIPWTDLGGCPAPGSEWTANFTRNRRTTVEQLSCWSVTHGGFHNTQMFGAVRFVERAPGLRELSLGLPLPGVNRLSALVLPAHDPVRLRMACVGGRVLLDRLITDSSSKAAGSYPYDLAPEEMAGALQISLEGPHGVCFRQEVRLPAVAEGAVADARSAVARLAAPRFAGVQTFRALRERGAALLQRLDNALARARRAHETLSPGEWNAFQTDLLAFRDAAFQPTIWTAEAASAVTPDMPPPSLPCPPTVDVAMAVNERASIAIRVNCPLSTTTQDLRFQLTDLALAGGGADAHTAGSTPAPPFARKRLLLREAVDVPTHGGGDIVDALPELPSSGILHVPPGQTREVWLTADSDGVAPGYYLGEMELSSITPFPCGEGGRGVRQGRGVRSAAARVPIRLRVWPIVLPRELPLSVFTCDYGLSGNSPAHLDDLLRHHTNVFNVNALPNPDADGHADCSRLSEQISLVRGKGLLFMEVWFMRDTGWRPQYARWVREVSDAMLKAGIPFDRWVLHIYDETLSDPFLECARQIKAVEPRIRIFSDCMGTAERVRAFAPYVDYWCPYWGDLPQKAGLEAMRATGKPVWTYDCGTEKRMPTGRYRVLPWRAWQHRLDGAFCWCYPGSAWNELPIEGTNYGHIYEGYRGEPVSSKRWEAWSNGLEDYALLRAYDDALRPAGKRAAIDDDLLKAAEAVCDDGGGDTTGMSALRRRIAHRLLELTGSPISRDFPAVSFPGWAPRILGDGLGTAGYQPGARTDAGEMAMVLRSPGDRSWTFLIKPLQAKPGDRVLLTLWVRGRGSLRVGICEGFEFGGDPSGHRISERALALQDGWTQIRIEHEVKALPVQALAGFDYGNPGGEAFLSDAELTVQHKDGGNTAPVSR
jgi:hypothetical protein